MRLPFSSKNSNSTNDHLLTHNEPHHDLVNQHQKITEPPPYSKDNKDTTPPKQHTSISRRVSDFAANAILGPQLEDTGTANGNVFVKRGDKVYAKKGVLM